MLFESRRQSLPPVRIKSKFNEERGFALAGTVSSGKQISDDLSFRDARFFDIWQLHRAVSRLLLERCIVSNFPIHPFSLQALFDNGDFLARRAIGLQKVR